MDVDRKSERERRERERDRERTAVSSCGSQAGCPGTDLHWDGNEMRSPWFGILCTDFSS